MMIEEGKCDACDPWPIPEPFWPSQSQQLKMNKAIVLRNQVLDYKQDQEEQYRSKVMDLFKIDHAQWTRYY